MIGFWTAPSRERAMERMTVSIRVGSCHETNAPASTPRFPSPAATRSERSRNSPKVRCSSSEPMSIGRSGEAAARRSTSSHIVRAPVRTSLAGMGSPFRTHLIAACGEPEGRRAPYLLLSGFWAHGERPPEPWTARKERGSAASRMRRPGHKLTGVVGVRYQLEGHGHIVCVLHACKYGWCMVATNRLVAGSGGRHPGL